MDIRDLLKEKRKDMLRIADAIRCKERADLRLCGARAG